MLINRSLLLAGCFAALLSGCSKQEASQSAPAASTSPAAAASPAGTAAAANPNGAMQDALNNPNTPSEMKAKIRDEMAKSGRR